MKIWYKNTSSNQCIPSIEPIYLRFRNRCYVKYTSFERIFERLYRYFDVFIFQYLIWAPLVFSLSYSPIFLFNMNRFSSEINITICVVFNNSKQQQKREKTELCYTRVNSTFSKNWNTLFEICFVCTVTICYRFGFTSGPCGAWFCPVNICSSFEFQPYFWY